METRANYILVGSFVLLLMVGLLGFVIWLAKFQFDTKFSRYDIFFTDSVTGLRAGGAVRYSGVQVGEIVFIGLDKENPKRVRALIEVDSTTPVKRDTVASLESQGLAGGRYILLSGGAPETPPLEAEADQKRPVIPSRPSTLQQVLDSAPELVESANLLLTRASLILDDRNLTNFATTLENMNRITASLAGRGDEVGQLIADAAGTMENLRGATGSLNELAAALKEDSARLTARAEATLASVEGLVLPGGPAERRRILRRHVPGDSQPGGGKPRADPLLHRRRALRAHDADHGGPRTSRRPEPRDDRGRARPRPFPLWQPAAGL
jgi:phospholipid/cholesterol/gamma-HCH transport system substrate-binding protein